MSNASSHKIKNDCRNTSDDGSNAWTDRRATELASRAANARQKSGRRRFVDPTTSEREYTSAELEFMLAMKDYKDRSGRMFPTWSEVLEVLRALGYEKVAPCDRDDAEGNERQVSLSALTH